MQQRLKHFLLTVLVALCSITTFAHDFEVDGIYYNYNGDGTSVEVTYRGSSYSSYTDRYTGAVTIPSSVTYYDNTYNVTAIGRSAFDRCSGLTSVNLPSSIVDIDTLAFWGCSGLTSIKIPKYVTKICGKTFESCSRLTSVTLPDGLTNIEYDAFKQCSSLTEIALPESVEEIGEQAFRQCEKLKHINIPSKLTYIKARTFWGCTSLNSIYLPEAITRIGSNAFLNCTGLGTVINHSALVVRKGATDNGYVAYYATEVVDDDCSIEETNACYVKHAATGMFLNGNNDWGTQASLTSYGQLMTLSKLASGQYMLDTNIGEAEYHYLGIHNPTFMDCGPTKLVIELQDDGTYSIKLNNKYLTATDDIVDFDSDKVVAGSKWMFVSYDEYIASLASATASNPVDATTLIGDPDFSRFNRYVSKWNGNVEKVGSNQNKLAEKWGGSSTTFDCYQTITDLPNGLYKVSVQGFYRYNNTDRNTNSVAQEAHANGTEKIYSYLYANTVSQPLMSIADEASIELAGGAMPVTATEAGDAFAKGAYGQNEVLVFVTDGTLRIGIKKMLHPGKDWTAWDSFRLTYYGSSVIATTYKGDSNGSNYILDANKLPEMDFGANGMVFVHEGCLDAELPTNIVKKNSEGEWVATEIELTDGQAFYNPSDVQAEVIRYNRNFTTANWQALYVPFDVQYEDWADKADVAYINDVHQFDDNGDGDIDRTTIEYFPKKNGKVKANTPYLIRPKQTGEMTLAGHNTTLKATPATGGSVDCSSTTMLYTLTGTYQTITDMYENRWYAISGGNFSLASHSGVTLSPFRSYLNITDREGNPVSDIERPSYVRLMVGGMMLDEETGIEQPNATGNADDRVYDLQGRRVDSPKHGLYIVGGKKMIIK